MQRTRILSIRVLAESSQNCNVVSCISLYWVTLPACRGRRPDWNRVMELFHEQRGVGGVMKLFGEELKNILRSLLMILHWDLSLRSSITDVTWKYYMIILANYVFHEQRGVGGVLKLFGEELRKILHSLILHLDLSPCSSITAVTTHLGSDYFGQLSIYCPLSIIPPSHKWGE